MAIFNEIETPRTARFFQKLFSIKGGAPVRQVAGEIVPSLAVWSGVENRFLDTWDRFGVAINIPAAAANLGGVRMRNPLGSNIVAVLEKLSFAEGATDQPVVTFGTDPGDLGTVIGTANSTLDRRSRPNPTLIASRQNSGPTVPPLASASTLWNNFLVANTSYDLVWDENQELLLLPGMVYQITATLVNTALTTSWVWRERTLEESETHL